MLSACCCFSCLHSGQISGNKAAIIDWVNWYICSQISMTMSQQPSDKRQRIIAIILTAAILILGYITLKQNNQVTDLEAEKTILITQLEDYKRDLLSQTTANDSLNVFIGQETTRLNEKIEEIEAWAPSQPTSFDVFVVKSFPCASKWNP